MAIKKFKIDTQKGAARIGSINVNGKSLETPFYFPVMSFFCGGNRPSDFGGGPYRMLKRDFLKGKYTKNLFQGVITSVSQFFDFGLKPKKIEYYLRKIELFFTGHWTLCGNCNRFSPQKYCPYC